MKSQDFIDNYSDITFGLNHYHELFYKLAAIGEPVLTDRVPTAAVSFDKEGNQLSYFFNPDFIEKITPYEIMFVMCHEMLHVIFNHGKRFNLEDKGLAQLNNIASDIVINHYLLSSFGFNYYLLPNLHGIVVDDNNKKQKVTKKMKSALCFIESIFSKDKVKTIKQEETFEYYFNQLKQDGNLDTSLQEKIGNGGSLDAHDMLDPLSKEELEEILTQAVGEEKAEKLMDALEHTAGVGGATDVFNAMHIYPPTKSSWENVIEGCYRSYKTYARRDTESYIWKSRRNMTLENIGGDLIIPNIVNIETDAKKFDLWLFQDVSSSCASYLQRFLSAARSIPQDIFNIRFHLFNSDVWEVGLYDKKYRTGGGTRFSQIEDYIQRQTGGDVNYPDVVFMITDGEGDPVKPEKPERWNWFLTYDYRSCIDPKCKVFPLGDYE